MTDRFDPLQGQIVNQDGTPTIAFQVYWQKFRESLESALGSLEDQVAAIAAAQAAADAANAAAANANTAAEEITAGNALTNSYVENFVAPVVSADNTGLVTIADHDRHYGDGTIVSVDGDTLATGLSNPDIAYIFYTDVPRAGGAVTYQFSTDEADAAQVGDVHNVGAVQIPAAGTASGGYARPPGYGGYIE